MYSNDMNGKNLPRAQSASISVHAVAVDDIDIQDENNLAQSWPVTNEGGARSYLSQYHWPSGLQDTLIRNLLRIPIRYFICDDSGSMVTSDGHRLLSLGEKKKFVSCSRWTELSDSLKFHSGLAHAASATSEFRFLNGETIRLGRPGGSGETELSILTGMLDGSPGGGTPLCKHIRAVTEDIRILAPSLRANNQKACIIIATDGESSDGDIATAMRPLQQLPVWVVVRLCTDEEKIVNYWNNIDNELELDMDVLDDLKGEAEEITEKNPWLVYGEPLHRLREFGIPIKEIDLIDETVLSAEQMRVLVASILGGSPDLYPHPDLSWRDFAHSVAVALSRCAKTWCPITETPRPWIDQAKLAKTYNKDNCIIS